MQDMIKTVKGATSLHGHKVLRLLDYTDLAPVTGTGTNGAGVIFGNPETGGTKSHPLDNIPQSFGQSHCVFRGFQQMKGESHGGPRADPR